MEPYPSIREGPADHHTRVLKSNLLYHLQQNILAKKKKGEALEADLRLVDKREVRSFIMWTMHIIFPNELPSPPISTVVNSVNSCHHHNLCFLICLKKKLQNWSTRCHTHTHIWCKETIYKLLSVGVHTDVQVGLKKKEEL